MYSAIWTNIFSILDKYFLLIFTTWSAASSAIGSSSIKKNTFSNLNKYILTSEKIYLAFWTIWTSCSSSRHGQLPHQQLVHPRGPTERSPNSCSVIAAQPRSHPIFILLDYMNAPTPSKSHPVFTRMASGQPT